MIWLSEVLRHLGMALFLGGYGVYALSILWRLVEQVRTRTLAARALVIGFYARAAGTVGLMTVLLGTFLRDPSQWWSLLVIFIFGAPALALLVVRPVRSDDVLGLGNRRGKT